MQKAEDKKLHMQKFIEYCQSHGTDMDPFTYKAYFYDWQEYEKDIIHKIPNDWECSSFHNDSMPSYTVSGKWDDDKYNLTLWFGSADPIIMDFLHKDIGNIHKRFTLDLIPPMNHSAYGENHYIFQSDNFDEVLNYIKNNDWKNAEKIN